MSPVIQVEKSGILSDRKGLLGENDMISGLLSSLDISGLGGILQKGWEEWDYGTMAWMVSAWVFEPGLVEKTGWHRTSRIQCPGCGRWNLLSMKCELAAIDVG